MKDIKQGDVVVVKEVSGVPVEQWGKRVKVNDVINVDSNVYLETTRGTFCAHEVEKK